MFSKQVVSSRSRLLSYYAQHHQRNLTRTITSRCDETDRLLIIGSGVAGSAAALIAAETHKIPTTLVYAGSQPTDCNSFWAQGGIIYKGKSNEDSPSLLAEDIHRAGAGLCSDDAVQKVSIEGSERVQQLLLDSALGRFANVPFQRNEDGELSLCLEASHAAPRILYKADHTGRVITEHITAAAARHPLISALDNTIVTDLIVREGVCIGIETLHGENHYASKGVVLASGGLAGIYQHSTNPPGFNALGSSVAMACRAGVETKDLEYVQFHPTALNIPNEARFLLTEALRGEGAILRNCYGEAFAKNFHADGELAPRDIVARGVFEEAQRTGADVRLDITHRDADWLYQRFPTIGDYVQTRGFDLAKDSLPITPAAHYTCGGVSTDLNGCTSLPNLYAAGEAARTGLHGGNRLASTSLLEGLVFGAAVADYVGSTADGIAEEAKSLIRSQNNFSKVSSSNRKGDLPTDEAEQLLQDLKRTMWDQVGVVRTPSGLSAALKKLQSMKEDADRLFRTLPCPKTAGLRDASEAGYAVATSALANRTAKGAHFIVDDAAEDDSDDVAVVG